MFQRPSPPVIETDLIVIGSGVSGITLAEQLLDSEIDFWLLGSPFESQLAKAGELRDTSLPEGTIGLKYIEERFESLKEQGLNHRSSLCTGIVPKDDRFEVKTKFQNFKSKYIVIASGAKQKPLGFEGEQKLFRKGISDCTVCDYPLYRERPVAVVGNHKYTVRAAELMRKHTPDVALLWYEASDPPIVDGVTVYENVTDLVAEGDESLTSISFTHHSGKEKLEVNGLFVEGKPFPDLRYLSDLDLQSENGYLVIDESYLTSIPNIYAIGDITGHSSNFDKVVEQSKELSLIIREIIN